MDWESLEVEGMVVETIFDQRSRIRPIYASNPGIDLHLNPVPPSPSLSFLGTVKESVEAAGISGEDISSFTRNLLELEFTFAPSGMGGSLDMLASLVGDNDLLAEREEFNLDASKCRGREEDTGVFKLNRGPGCGIDRSSPTMLLDCQFRE